jgi:hypothetical protein
MSPQAQGVEGAGRTPLASWLLAFVTFCAIADNLFGLRLAALVGAPFLVVYIAREWRILLTAARVLLIVCAGLAVVAAMRPDGWDVLTRAASRLIYFPAFVAMLGLLRAAASRSQTTAAAGRFLVAQPPSRRYVALTLGGHFFGILFNIGGLALLIDMVRKANTLASAGGVSWVQELREKRMVVAIMRGFSCIALWSPLGVAMNLLIASMPGLAWADVAPYGVSVAIAFMALGWLFDRFETRPSGAAVSPPAAEPRGGMAVARIIGHVVGLSLIGLVAELLTDLSFQALLLALVPAYALAWAAMIEILERRPGPIRAALAVLTARGVRRFGSYANEIAVFSTSGFLGVVLVALAPREAIQAWIIAAALSPGVVMAGLAALVVALGMIGVNPIVTCSILAGSFASIQVPGLSQTAVVMALAAGWTCVISVGPAMSSLVMASAQLGRPSRQVGLQWNGRYAATAFVLTIAGLLAAGRLM